MTPKTTRGKPDVVRPLGMDRGSVIVSDDFDAPLPPELLAQFLGEPSMANTKTPKKPAASKRQRIDSRKSRGE